MSAVHHESLIERHWYVLLVLFGLLFVGSLDLFGGPDSSQQQDQYHAGQASAPAAEPSSSN